MFALSNYVRPDLAKIVWKKTYEDEEDQEFHDDFCLVELANNERMKKPIHSSSFKAKNDNKVVPLKTGFLRKSSSGSSITFEFGQNCAKFF